MIEAEQTKVCPLCAETIKAKAKVCPYCQTRQHRFSLLKGELTGILLMLGAIIAYPFSLDWAFGDQSDNRPSLNFIIHRNDLSVQQVTWKVTGKNEDYWLTGYVTNGGIFSWRIHELEVRITNPQNDLVDVCHLEFGKSEKFVVQPGQEHAFGIQFKTPLLNKDSKLVARVQKATDGRERYAQDFD
jgi:hypothetical protein